MHSKYLNILIPCLAILAISSCKRKEIYPPEEGVSVYTPIYESIDIRKIETISPQPLEDPGQIYFKDDYIFINEKYKGIHVIDNSDPKSPKNISFLAIPGNLNIAIMGSIIYADNYNDLIVVDATDVNNMLVVGRQKNIYDNDKLQYRPPFKDVYFDCPNGDKGEVVGWIRKDAEKAECFTATPR